MPKLPFTCRKFKHLLTWLKPEGRGRQFSTIDSISAKVNYWLFTQLHLFLVIINSALQLKPRSNDFDFSNTTCNICRTFGCTLLHVVGSLRGQTHLTFFGNICSKRVANYRNKRNVLLHNICRCNIFDPDQTSFNNIQRAATCLDIYKQGGQTITTFSTRQMLHVVLRKVELV